MEEFSEIYVNIGNVRTSYGLYDQRNIIECNEFTKAGTRTNPLTIHQFRDYLYYDHGKDQTFHVKGSAILDTDSSSDVAELGVDTLFETPHTNRHVVIKNWENESVDVQEPWMITVSGSDFNVTNGQIRIVSNNDVLELVNGEIELVGVNTRISFGVADDNVLFDDVDSNTNRIGIINTKIYTSAVMDIDNNIHSFSFNNYHHIDIVNSIINNREEGGSIIVNNTYTSGNSINLVNSVFNRFDYFYGFPSAKIKEYDVINALVRQCVFSSPLTGFVRGGNIDTLYNLFNIADFNIDGNVQLSWSGCSACDESFVNMSQSADFNYLNESWIDISVSGLTSTIVGTVYDEYDISPYQFTKYRDGIGALSFPPLGDAFVSIVSAGDVMSISAFNLSGGTVYDDLYKPSLYKWLFDDSYNEYANESISSATSAFGVTHSYNTYGDRRVDVEIYSHNRWYSIFGQEPAYIVLTPSFEMILNRVVDDCYQDYFSSGLDGNGVLSAYTHDIIDLQVDNTSVDSGQTFKLWGTDFSQYPTKYTNNNMFWEKNSYPDSGMFAHQQYSHYEEFKYIQKGYYRVFFGAKSMNNEVYIDSVPIQILDRPQEEHYVNLDSKYDYSDKWLYKRTGVYDTFESGELDSGWGTAFKSNFSVVDMWGDNCATGDEQYLIDTSASYAFDYEWSFVRTGRDPIPSVSLVSADGNTDLMKVQWDYNNDKILFKLNGVTYQVKYNLKKMGLLKDLNCANSLRDVGIKVKTNVGPFTNQIKFYIKFTDTWIEYSYIFDDLFPSEAYLIKADTPTGSGFGYLKMQSRCGFSYINGSEDYPLTFDEFVTVTSIDEYDEGKLRNVLPTADYKSKFYFTGYRTVDDISYRCIPDRFYEIDSWDFSATGPWMLIWDIRYPFRVDMNNYYTDRISFDGATLKNGIMYNIKEGDSPGLYIVPNLEISFVYNMVIVWNSSDDDESRYSGYIKLTESQNEDRKIYNTYANNHGSTIIAEKGFAIFYYDFIPN